MRGRGMPLRSSVQEPDCGADLLSESGAEDAESADTSDEPTKGGPEKAAKPRKKKPAGINDK